MSYLISTIVDERQKRMQIEIIPIQNIFPYDGNAKTHPPAQIAEIAESIRRYGMVDPVGVWGQKNEIVEGHGRVEALKKLGIGDVPCIRLDHLSDEERREYSIVHNQTTMSTPFDFSKLKFELDFLKSKKRNIKNVGLNFNFDDNFDDVLPDNFDTNFTLPDGDRSEFRQMTFSLHDLQIQEIESAMERVKNDICETYGNTNKNGNALHEVIRQWAMLKK